MNDIVNKSRSALRAATNDFVKTARRAQATLNKERDRLAAKLKRLNERIRRMEAGARLKQGLAEAKTEARAMRAEFKLVSANLREAGTHLSHALHIDRAVKSIEAKAKVAMQQRNSKAKAAGKKKPTGRKKTAPGKTVARRTRPKPGSKPPAAEVRK